MMKKICLSIDLGATNIRFLLYDRSRKRCIYYKKNEFVSCKSTEEEVDKNLCCVVENELSNLQMNISDLEKVVVVMAPNFDRKNGTIVRWPNHQLWEGFHLKDYLQNKWGLGIEIIFEDDANGALLGERLFLSSDLKHKNSIYITVSTGIGGALFFNGKLYLGDSGYAGEFGHITINGNNKKCNCGKRGCLQTIASGPAILKNFKQRFGKKYDVHCLQEVSEMAYQKNEDALEVFEEVGIVLAAFSLNLIELLDVSCIIYGGGVIHNCGDTIIEKVKEQINAYCNQRKSKVLILKSGLGEYNGVIGGLALCCNEELNSISLLNEIKNFSVN